MEHQSRYRYVQLVAYEVPTSELTGSLRELKGPLSVNSFQETDPATQKLLVDDAGNRVDRLLNVLKWTRQNIQDDRSTLKIFMAPEFYFRATKDGYSWNTVPYILDALRAGLKDPMLENWLIVPGTICSHQQPPKAFFNTASIIKGGGSNIYTYFQKERIAERDGVPALYDPMLSLKLYPTLGAWPERKARILTVDGITFGLEVCMDHSQQILKQVCLEWPKWEGTPAPLIDVHLITSCGMEIEPTSVSARTDGCVLLCDGLISKDANWRHSQVQFVSHEGMADLKSEATLAGIDKNFDTIATPIWESPVPDEYKISCPEGVTRWFDNKVVCYPPVLLF